ncbi:ABC transporter substrate-binding protein [Lysinimonas soli]|uniref:ABC transporter substrate-binding protein n=1 Tax=Lysinimonas soli TaxID=1074233 RepID=A0ABW0NNB4_9MICO
MNTSVRRISALAIAMIAATALAACSTPSTPTTPTASKPGAVTDIAVSSSPSSGNASLYLPIQDGSYKAAGLNVTPQVLQNGAQAVPLLLNGQLQFAASDPLSALAAISQGTPISIVAAGAIVPTDASKDPNGAIVAADSTITSLKGLNGKTVAVNGLNGFAAVSMKAAIDAAGGDSSSIKWVEIPIPQMQTSVANHTVDAAVTTEPFITAAEAAGSGVKPLPGGGIATATGGLPQLVYLASDDYIAQHKDTVSAFVSAVNAAAKKLTGDPSLIRTVAKTSTTVSADVLDKMTLPAFGPLTLKAMTKLQSLAVKYHVLSGPVADLPKHVFTN